MLVGHRYADWPRHSDFYSPLLSHVRSFFANSFILWVEFIRKRAPGVPEADPS